MPSIHSITVNHGLIQSNTNTTIRDEQLERFKFSSDASYESWRNAVYEQLVIAGMDSDAERWLSCETYHKIPFSGEDAPVGTKNIACCSREPLNHPRIAFKSTCGLRYCPTCAEQHSARLLARYAPVLTELALKSGSRRLRKIMLSTPYSLEDDSTGDHYKKLMSAIPVMFDDLLGTEWRDHSGLLVGAEIGENGYKLHFHLLAYCKFIDQKQLATAWNKATDGHAEVVWIAEVSRDKSSVEKAIAEQLKYCTKFWKLKHDGSRSMIDPHLIPKLAKLLAGTRRIRSYGLFYKIPEPEPETHYCEVCGSPMVMIWQSDWILFRETCMTWEDLNLKLANNFPNGPPENKFNSPPEQRKFDFLDEIRIKGQNAIEL